MFQFSDEFLNKFRDVRINNKTKKIMSARTIGILMGRGTPGKVDFFLKSKNKICIENDTNILLSPKIKYIFIDNKFIPMIKSYIKRNDVIVKGWVKLTNINVNEHSRL